MLLSTQEKLNGTGHKPPSVGGMQRSALVPVCRFEIVGLAFCSMRPLHSSVRECGCGTHANSQTPTPSGTPSFGAVALATASNTQCNPCLHRSPSTTQLDKLGESLRGCLKDVQGSLEKEFKKAKFRLSRMLKHSRHVRKITFRQ